MGATGRNGLRRAFLSEVGNPAVCELHCYSTIQKSHQPHGSWPFHGFACYNSWNSHKPWMEPAAGTAPGGGSKKEECLPVALWIALLQCYSQSHQPHSSQLFHDLTGTTPSFHCSNHEAVNGGMASGGGSNWQLFWKWLVTYSAIHKAASLMVPGHSMILPGTISETPISHEWSWQREWPLGVVPTRKNACCQLCE